MPFAKCPTCHADHWTPRKGDLTGHVCKPEWEVVIEDYDGEEDWQRRFADSADEAAEEAVKAIDSHDGAAWIVTVREPGDAASAKRVKVVIEFLPAYRVVPMLVCAECGKEFGGVGFTDPSREDKICQNCVLKRMRAERDRGKAEAANA